MPTTNRIDVDGRPHINRAEIADRTGISAKTQRNLYVERATNGHPEAHLQGREAFFDEQRVIEWYTAWAEHKQANRRPPQDDAGDADELLDVPAATRFLGYASQSTIRGYLARNDGYFPEADDCEDLPSGRVRRRWKRSTLRPPRGRGNRPVPALTPPHTPVVAHPFSPGKMRRSVLPTIHKRCKVGHIGRDGKPARHRSRNTWKWGTPMRLINRVRASDMFSWTDLFCGAGGSSSGIESVPGNTVITACNHWA